MLKILITKAFEKARENEILKGIKSPSKNYLSKVLSDYISEQVGFSIGEKSIKNYYDAIDKLEEDEDINIPQIKVITGLCNYLGYEDFISFSNANTEEEEQEEKEGILITILQKRKTITIILGLLIIGTLGYNYATRERWMVWQNDHYEEVAFDLETYNIKQLKRYKEERIDFFKKITPPCDYPFFNPDGSVKVWYGKNYKKELEYFTALGLHPGTGKTLKPITRYMINKYICADSLEENSAIH